MRGPIINEAQALGTVSATGLTSLIEGGSYGGNLLVNTVTFDGGTENGIGDHDGTSDPYTVFTVTGTVLMELYQVCTTALVGATATVQMGVTGATTAFIGVTTATDIDVDEIWFDTSPTTTYDLLTVAGLRKQLINRGNNIQIEVATQNITAGVIDFVCIWTGINGGTVT